MRTVPSIIAALMLAAPAASWAEEKPVDPYVQSPANAGASPMKDDSVYRAFHEKAGIDRVVNDLVDRAVADPRISDIFKEQDLERLRRTLGEQFCFLLGGPCTYTGRDMKTAHKDMGVQMADMNALVENLQKAMDKEKVSFSAQNKLLAKLAPQSKMIVER